nr:Zinc finger domain containing protein [Haemonchus contortus]
MYVLLNLKDGSRLSDVVQLLFSHGHTAVSVAERVEDLCPQCECMSRQTQSGLEQSQTNSTTPTTSVDGIKCQSQAAVSSEEIDPRFDSRFANSDTPSEEVEEAFTECQSLMHQSEAKMKSPPPPAADVKEEDAVMPKSEVTGSTEQLSITSAIELLCPAGPSVTVYDETSPEVKSTECPSSQQSKRKARKKGLGLEKYQCQLCKKAITRQGQYANLVNHLSRHSRLHASKKQYCCPVCRASFSRRYLAYSHVREAHSKHGFLEPLDHGRELREEYRALLEVCFPGRDITADVNIEIIPSTLLDCYELVMSVIKIRETAKKLREYYSHQPLVVM